MENELLAEIKACGAIVEGHFIGTSGRHLSTYLAKDAVMPHTALVSKICKEFALRVVGLSPTVVVGPTTCGIILSQWTAHHLRALADTEVLAVFTDEENDTQFLKRKYDQIVRGARVVIVEDVVNTGKSIGEVVAEVRRVDGQVVQAISIFNRGESDAHVSAILGVPYQSLIQIPLESYGESEVPAWLSAVPISVEYGHGSKYLDGRKDN